MKNYTITAKSNTNSITDKQYLYEQMVKSNWIKPNTQYYKLRISAHKPCDEEEFHKYLYDKKIAIIDNESFKNILIYCNLSEGYMLNENKLFQDKYGARYVGYSYFFDWRATSSTVNIAKYNYYFNIKNVKKFNYARIKIGF